MVFLLVIGALGGGIRQMMVDMRKLFENKDLLKRNNLWNGENSIDGQWDYLEKDSLRTCSRDGWRMIYQRLEYYLEIKLLITPSIIHALLVSSLTAFRFWEQV